MGFNSGFKGLKTVCVKSEGEFVVPEFVLCAVIQRRTKSQTEEFHSMIDGSLDNKLVRKSQFLTRFLASKWKLVLKLLLQKVPLRPRSSSGRKV